MTSNLRALLVSACLSLYTLLPSKASEISYQGQLQKNGFPAQGVYDFQFLLWDTPSGGRFELDSHAVNDVSVDNGIFSVLLNFDAALFDGADRWLEIHVRAEGEPVFTVLDPRRPMTRAPYAIRADHVDASGILGTLDAGHIADGSITGSMLADGSVAGDDLASGAVDVSKLDTTTLLGSRFVVPHPYPADLDQFGSAVSGVGTEAVLVGAPGKDGRLGLDLGAAYLLGLQGGLLVVLTNPTPRDEEFFGTAVASAGPERLLVSAPNAEPNPEGRGAVFVFDRQGTLLNTIAPSNRGMRDTFGRSLVGLGSDKVLVGSPLEDLGAGETGAAFLFHLDGTLRTTLMPPAPEPGGYFGTAVATVGLDRLLIGAMRENLGEGAAYLFDLDGQHLTTFTSPKRGRDQRFGRAVAGVGLDKVLIGADGESLEGTIRGVGAAYLFNLKGTLLTTYTNPAPQTDGYFGFSVAAVGADRVLIGAYGNDSVEQDAGAAYLYDLQGNLIASLTNSPPGTRDGKLGYAVSAVGLNKLLVGAPERDVMEARARAGEAYLFFINRVLPGLDQAVGEASVFSSSIVEGAVLTEKLAVGSVTTEKLADAAVTSTKLAPSSIQASHIFPRSVTADKMADNVAVWTRSGGNVYLRNSNVGIRTNDPAGMALNVNGDARVTGLIRSGSEQLTSEPPRPAGLVLRRINSGATTGVVARTELLALERDESAGGFRIRALQPVQNLGVFVACMGISRSGEARNVFKSSNFGQFTGGLEMVYHDSDDVVFFQCTFGMTGSNDHLTQVTLTRWTSNSSSWAGTLISTYNQ